MGRTLHPVVAALKRAGQSVWLDDLSRDLAASGLLESLIDDGLTGGSIHAELMERSLSSGSLYDAAIRRSWCAHAGAVEGLYEVLLLQDARMAADLLRPVYRRTEGADGFATVDVPPALAHEAEATVVEARQLWRRASRVNLMIQVPATAAGLEAMRRLVRGGVSVGATMIFCEASYRAAMECYWTGLEERLADGLPVEGVHSAASFSVGRIDAWLSARCTPAESVGLASASLAYEAFREGMASPRWHRLQAHGARPQRLVWSHLVPRSNGEGATHQARALVLPGTTAALCLETYLALRWEPAPAAAKVFPVRAGETVSNVLSGVASSPERLNDALLEESIAKAAAAHERMLASLRKRCTRLMGAKA